MNINLKIEDTLNDRRKHLKATWKEVLVAGLHSLENKPFPNKKIETHLKKAIMEIKETWDIVKGERK